MNAPLTPDTMTAEDRRQSWFQNELIGYDGAVWDYGDELLEILSGRFGVIEMILGKENAAPHLFAMLPGSDIEGETWEEAFTSYRLCCTNRLMAGVPLSPDRLIPRAL